MSGGKASKEFSARVKEAQKEVRKMGDNASESAKWLAKIGEEGMISAEMVSMAMQAETGVGGRFYQGMEQASQTLSGMWSTLKDDSMQLLGNLFEPVSEGLAKYVLPAAQGVVSALNGLFEGDTNLVITADVQEAIKNVGSLDTDLAALMVGYQNKVIKIRLEADKAEELVTELEKLEEQLSGTPKSLWTEQDKKDLQEITSRLVAIYPELQKYVGNDGILKLEAAEVQNLITKYENLALAKAEAEYRSAYEGRVEEARINQEMLEVELDGYKQQKQEAEALQQTWQKLSEDSSKAYGDFLLSPTGIPENLDASSVEEYLSLVEKYVQLAGGLEGLDSDSSIRGVFDETGQILDAESFLSDMELLGNLANSLTEIDTLAQTQSKKQDEIISQTSEAISLTSQAVEAAKTSVSQAIAELARFEAALARLNAEGQQEQKETGAETVNNIAQGADENSNELDDTVKNVVDGSAQSVDTSAFSSVGNNIVSGIVSGVYKNSGSLTKAMVDIANIALDAAKRGLDINSPSGRFRDEVGAMIPRGVAVGVDQNAWRVARSVTGMVDASLPDVSGIASGMAPRPLMLSGLRYAPSSTEAYGVTNQTINFNVPVQTPGEFAQTMYLYQTYGLTEA